MAKSMTVSGRAHQTVESYDEDEAKHRFESALRGARRAHDQRMRGQQAAEKEHAGARRHGDGKP
jgi:hypothetical protein